MFSKMSKRTKKSVLLGILCVPLLAGGIYLYYQNTAYSQLCGNCYKPVDSLHETTCDRGHKARPYFTCNARDSWHHAACGN